MSIYTGINFVKDIKNETIVYCNNCDKEFIFDNVEKFKSLEPISVYFILCPHCQKRFEYFFWFEMIDKWW